MVTAGTERVPFQTTPLLRNQNSSGPTQPPIQWVPGALSLEVKRQGHEADHSPPFSAEVKNACSYTSTSQYIFVAWCLVKHRDNCTFILPPFHLVELRHRDF
jgi:hypothetical protein